MGRKRKLPEGSLDFEQEYDGYQGDKEDNPELRNTANARERARMRVLSKAFVRLKTTLPWVPPDTKLSKLDTLRLASCYIAHLKQILTEDGGGDDYHTDSGDRRRNVRPMSMTWPYTFNGRAVPHPHSNRMVQSTAATSSPGEQQHMR